MLKLQKNSKIVETVTDILTEKVQKVGEPIDRVDRRDCEGRTRFGLEPVRRHHPPSGGGLMFGEPDQQLQPQRPCTEPQGKSII